MRQRGSLLRQTRYLRAMTVEPLSDEALLARLIAFDTTSHKSNREIADFISDYLDRPGVRIIRHPTADGTKLNLIVAAGPEDGDRGLVLSGHMDVVPAESEGWESDPFTLMQRDGSYVARGAVDMKGFLALAINRLAAARRGRRELRARAHREDRPVLSRSLL